MHNAEPHTLMFALELSCFRDAGRNVRSAAITSHVICFADFNFHAVIDTPCQMAY